MQQDMHATNSSTCFPILQQLGADKCCNPNVLQGDVASDGADGGSSFLPCSDLITTCMSVQQPAISVARFYYQLISFSSFHFITSLGFFFTPSFVFLFLFLARLLLKRQLLPDNRNKQYSHCSRFQCLYMSVLLCAYVVFSIYERSLPRAVFFFFFLLLPSTNE